MVAEVFAENNLERPPIVMIVSEDDPLIAKADGYNNQAVAVLLKSGREVILFNRDSTSGNCREAIVHEVAHLIAWRRFGPEIKMHGREFRQVCRSIARKNKRSTCH